MAQIYKKQGNWAFRVYYFDDNGKRKSINKQGFKLKSDAQDAARELELKRARIGLSNSESATFANYFEDWIQAYRIGRRDSTTENKYNNASKFIKKQFGNTLLKNVTKVDYQKALDKYGENHVKDTVSNFNSYVRLVVQEAMDEGIIYKDFTRKVEIDSQVKSNNRLKFLEENEAVKLRNYCLKSGGIFSITKFEIALAIATGFRYAEVVGLTWNDIDFTDNKISVNKTYNYKDHDGFKPTKTESSIRTIDVDSQTISMLKQLQLEQKKCFLRQGYKNKDNLVFINHKHTVPTNTAANKALQKALDTLKIKKSRTFHSLRHTHASMLIANNVSIEYIAERLGHSNTSTTAKTYIHLLQKRRESEVKKTINLFTNVN